VLVSVLLSQCAAAVATAMCSRGSCICPFKVSLLYSPSTLVTLLHASMHCNCLNCCCYTRHTAHYLHACIRYAHAQQAADLDVVNEAEHLSFIVSTANVLAVNYGVVPPPEQELLPLDHPQRNKDAIAKVSTVLSLDVSAAMP
jgi:hypothetical protein